MNSETIGELHQKIKELEIYFDYFEFINIYGGENVITIAEKNRHDDDIVSFNYDYIYNRINDITNDIKEIIIKSQITAHNLRT